MTSHYLNQCWSSYLTYNLDLITLTTQQLDRSNVFSCRYIHEIKPFYTLHTNTFAHDVRFLICWVYVRSHFTNQSRIAQWALSQSKTLYHFPLICTVLINAASLSKYSPQQDKKVYLFSLCDENAMLKKYIPTGYIGRSQNDNHRCRQGDERFAKMIVSLQNTP